MFRFTIRDVLWLTVVVAVVLVAFVVRSQPTQWEYKMESGGGPSPLKMLNEAGADGWELVSAETKPTGFGQTFYFKRRK